MLKVDTEQLKIGFACPSCDVFTCYDLETSNHQAKTRLVTVPRDEQMLETDMLSHRRLLFMVETPPRISNEGYDDQWSASNCIEDEYGSEDDTIEYATSPRIDDDDEDNGTQTTSMRIHSIMGEQNTPSIVHIVPDDDNDCDVIECGTVEKETNTSVIPKQVFDVLIGNKPVSSRCLESQSQPEPATSGKHMNVFKE